MSAITFPVPATTTSRFAVAADRVPHDLANLLPRAPSGPYDAHIAGRLGTPQLELSRDEPASMRWNPLRVRAARPEERREERAFHDATEFAVVTATAPITDQPRASQVARAAARALADAVGGIAADLVTGHILAPGGERPRFVLADRWLGDVLPPFRADGRCTAPDPEHDPEGVNGCSCVRLRTRGLRRFGLPELQIDGVACPHDLAALNVLRSAARRLVTDHWSWLATGPADRSRTIDRDVHLTEADFGDFWGSGHRVHLTPPSPFRIRLGPLTARLLTVDPPEEFGGTVNDWLWGDQIPLGLYDVIDSPGPLPAVA